MTKISAGCERDYNGISSCNSSSKKTMRHINISKRIYKMSCTHFPYLSKVERLHYSFDIIQCRLLSSLIFLSLWKYRANNFLCQTLEFYIVKLTNDIPDKIVIIVIGIIHLYGSSILHHYASVKITFPLHKYL